MAGKTWEQLNSEYAGLKHLDSFCQQMMRQTGRGAPERAVYSTTIINIGTAWQESGTLEEVVRARMEHEMAFYRKRLPEIERWTRSPLPDRFAYVRELAAYEDLWRRMATHDWTIPSPIRPVVFCIVIDPHNEHATFDHFFSALYHATVFDVRERQPSRKKWSIGALRALGLHTTNQKVDLRDAAGQAAIRCEIEQAQSTPVTLLCNREQHWLRDVLRQHFSDVEFFLMMPERQLEPML